ncbi:MAG: DUF2147 domain-containing protein [Spirochaetaceae bacterium]|jgi:uncharacterized protein (DUF2147 family)|nr:DUF2147 domain-containing protein [Spirochaetaceae bacterium]
MKKTIALLVLALLVATSLFAADPAEGYWASYDDKTGKITAGWQIWQEGGKLNGKIVALAGFDATATADNCEDSYDGFPFATGPVNKMTVVGTTWLWGLNPVKNKPGQWSQGFIIDPDSGGYYYCAVTYNEPNTRVSGKRYSMATLKMRGSLDKLGVAGRNQIWQKVTEAEAKAIK